MRLSVIIVNYNTCALLRECLQSVSEGCVRECPEIWVVDNNSTDGSPEMVRREFPEVKLIVNDRNRGFAGANNQALRQAAGDYYLLFNSDARFTPGSGDALVDFMDTHPDAGMASAQLRFPDNSFQHTAAGLPTVCSEFFPKSLLRIFLPAVFYPKNFGQGREAAEVAGLVGAALMVRRETAAQVGFYDEDFFFFFEETDWCARVRAAGWKILIAPGISIIHAQGKTARLAPIPVRIEYWRSRYTYFRKHFPPAGRKLLYATLIIKNFCNLLLNLPLAPFSVRSAHRTKLAWRVFVWHWRGRPADMGISQTVAVTDTPD